MAALHVILVCIGTDGDVIPYVGLGTRLRARGHKVTLTTQAPYRALAAEHGFDFRELFSEEETEEGFAHPDLWHPIKGAYRLARWGSRFLPRQYELIAELACTERSVLVASPALLSARLVQEKLRRPLASVLLQPWMIQSVSAPPVMPGGLTLPRWAPRPVGWLYWRLIDAVGDLLMGRPFNRLRSTLGLKPVRRPFQWWLSPERVLGLFPEWYGQPQPDWPPQLRLAGFPLYDGRPDGRLPANVAEFLEAGTPPVVFTFGTGMRQARELFQTAVSACGQLGLRGLLLTKYGPQVPESLPPSIRHYSFAPFRSLFPHCAAVVHHGGIGTVARALAAGVPQLLLPFAYDQLDNAVRVRHLGVGDSLGPKHRTATALSQAVDRLRSTAIRERCQATAAQFGTHDALEVAAGWIEELGAFVPQTSCVSSQVSR